MLLSQPVVCVFLEWSRGGNIIDGERPLYPFHTPGWIDLLS
jgi:hypothetical protein